MHEQIWYKGYISTYEATEKLWQIAFKMVLERKLGMQSWQKVSHVSLIGINGL